MLAVAPFFAGQTQRNTLFLNGNIMQLHYKTDHTSCLNYKTESFGGFTLGKMSEGKRFNNQKEPVKVNHLIFILEGEVSIVKDNECDIGSGRRVCFHSHFIALCGYGHPARTLPRPDLFPQ